MEEFLTYLYIINEKYELDCMTIIYIGEEVSLQFTTTPPESDIISYVQVYFYYIQSLLIKYQKSYGQFLEPKVFSDLMEILNNDIE